MSFREKLSGFFHNRRTQSVLRSLAHVSAEILLSKYQPKIARQLQKRGLDQETSDRLSQQLTDQLLNHVENFESALPVPPQ